MKKEKLEKLREEMTNLVDSMENLHPELEYAANWIEKFEDKMRKALAEAIDEYPKGKDTLMESLIFGLAHFTCKLFDKMERQGMGATDGSRLYDIYLEVMMPTAQKAIEAHSEEEETNWKQNFGQALIGDMTNPDISIETIMETYFKKELSSRQRKDLYNYLTKMREDVIKAMKEHTN